MKKNKIYDKVAWHFPEGKDCPSIEIAKKHFKVIMKWLSENKLLNGEGEELFEFGIDADFSLTSSMLNEKGNLILGENYKKWIQSIDYKKEPSIEFLNNELKKNN